MINTNKDKKQIVLTNIIDPQAVVISTGSSYINIRHRIVKVTRSIYNSYSEEKTIAFI